MHPTALQSVLPLSYEALVETLITGGANKGVVSTPLREVITADPGGQAVYTLTVEPTQVQLLIAHQLIQCDAYTDAATLSLSIDGMTILPNAPLTEALALRGAELPFARHQLVYTLTNSQTSGQVQATIDIRAATLDAVNAERITALLTANYQRVLALTP